MSSYFGGKLAFLNLVNDTSSVTGNQTGLHQINTGGFVLDDFGPNNDWIYMSNYNSNYYNAAAPFVVPGAGVVTDSPSTTGKAADYPNSDFYTNINMDSSFKTYLLYASRDGFWISVADMSWQLAGTATFNNPNGPGQGVPADYSDPDNWTASVTKPNPNNAGTVTGTIRESIVEWNDSFRPNHHF
jgi:hypothetical protein